MPSSWEEYKEVNGSHGGLLDVRWIGDGHVLILHQDRESSLEETCGTIERQ